MYEGNDCLLHSTLNISIVYRRSLLHFTTTQYLEYIQDYLLLHVHIVLCICSRWSTPYNSYIGVLQLPTQEYSSYYIVVLHTYCYYIVLVLHTTSTQQYSIHTTMYYCIVVLHTYYQKYSTYYGVSWVLTFENLCQTHIVPAECVPNVYLRCT